MSAPTSGSTPSETAELYRAFFDRAGDCLLVLQPDAEGMFVVVDANQATLDAHGYGREELIGQPLTLLDPQVSPPLVRETLAALGAGRPVVLEFVYTTCTSICPILSGVLSQLQGKLGGDADRVHLVSISIDPENDTPKVMKEYLKRYQAKPGWDFLTGSRADIDKVMHAFDAYISNKMYHYPLNLIRDPKNGKWVRIFGLTSTSEFMNEYKKVSGL